MLENIKFQTDKYFSNHINSMFYWNFQKHELRETRVVGIQPKGYSQRSKPTMKL